MAWRMRLRRSKHVFPWPWLKVRKRSRSLWGMYNDLQEKTVPTESVVPRINPAAGQLPTKARLVDLTKLIDAYSELKPDPSQPAQRVAFGTSGHRGSSFNC